MGGLLGVLIAVYLLFYKCGEFGGKIDRQSKEKWHKERMKRWGLEIVDEEMEGGEGLHDMAQSPLCL